MADEAMGKDKHACAQNDADQFNMDRVIAVRMTMQPQHTNGRGKIFGGRLLELMDLAGAYGAHRVCKSRFIPDMVTRVMNEVEFKQPVEVNDAVSFYSTVVKVGKTSVTVKVEVEADRGGNTIPVLSSTMVFVAVDSNNKPVSIRNSACSCATTANAQATDHGSVQTATVETNHEVAEHSEGNEEHSCKHHKNKKNKKNKHKRCKKHKCCKKHKRDKSE